MEFIIIFLLVASSVFLGFIAVYSLLHMKVQGSVPLFFLISAALLWTIATYAEVNSGGFESKLFWRNIQQIGVFAVPLSTLYFTMYYTSQWKIKPFLIVSTFVESLSVILIFTDKYFNIMRQNIYIDKSDIFGNVLVVESTTIGKILVAFNYFLPFLSIVLLFVFLKKVSSELKRQVITVILSMILTFGITLLKTAILTSLRVYIPMTVLYIPGVLMLAYALFRHELLNIAPIARDKLFEVIEQGIIVTDVKGKIVDINTYTKECLKKIYPEKTINIGTEIEKVVNYTNFINDIKYSLVNVQEEFSVQLGSGIFYLYIQIYPLFNNKTNKIGNVIILTDITEKKKKELDLKEKAEKDNLTGLFNRNGIENELKKVENGKVISVLMIDVDDFKIINDKYGHPVGDKILKAFSDMIKDIVGKEGIVGRIGGDEMVVIFPDKNKREAYIIAEIIRKKSEISEFIISDNEKIYYTLSIGVSQVFKEDIELNSMLNDSDKALYRAKENSKNKTVVYEK